MRIFTMLLDQYGRLRDELATINGNTRYGADWKLGEGTRLFTQTNFAKLSPRIVLVVSQPLSINVTRVPSASTQNSTSIVCLSSRSDPGC